MRQNTPKNIVLIGLKGCGKTSVGARLAALLDRPFFDSTRIIEAAHGKRAAGLSAPKAEAKFRRRERGCLRRLARKKGCVIAAGEGCVLNPKNMVRLARSGLIICLKSTPEALLRNLGVGEDEAPAFRRLYAERAPLYELCAAYTLDVSDHSAEENVWRLLDLLGY